jgi:cytochrome c oxidase cbb3-type subunit III
VGSFEGDFWNFFIVVVTLGSLFGLFLLTYSLSGGRTSKDESDEVETMGHVWDGDLEELNNPLPRWWLNLFYLTILFAVIYLMLYPGLGNNRMLLGWTQVDRYEREVAQAQERYGPIFARFADEPIEVLARDEEALSIGRRLYATYCTQCHGADAGGVRGFPNLRDGRWQWGGEPEAIRTSILDGRTGVMPGWLEALEGEEGVRAVAHHVLALAGREADAEQARAGEPLYQQLCVACHGPEGRGNPALGAPDLTADVWLYGGSLEVIEETVAHGRQGLMPAHREFLGEERVHLIAAYVYSLSRSE